MRRKVRGLRHIERQMLAEQDAPATGNAGAAQPAAVEAPAAEVGQAIVAATPPCVSEGGQVVLDYCAAVRGILNDDQGGPLHPPGVRMAEAIHEVRDSIRRARVEKKQRAAMLPECRLFRSMKARRLAGDRVALAARATRPWAHSGSLKTIAFMTEHADYYDQEAIDWMRDKAEELERDA